MGRNKTNRMINEANELNKRSRPAFPTLNALLPEIQKAEASFINDMVQSDPDGGALNRFNGVLKRGFEGMVLDLGKHNRPNTSSLVALYAPKKTTEGTHESLWFGVTGTDNIHDRLKQVAQSGNLALLQSHATNAPKTSEDLSLVKDKERLLWRITRSLKAGHCVELKTVAVRLAKQGATWEHDEGASGIHRVTAMENGLYIRLPITNGTEASGESRTTWMKAGAGIDSAKSVLTPYIDAMDAHECAVTMQKLVFHAALRVIDTESKLHGVKTSSALAPANRRQFA